VDKKNPCFTHDIKLVLYTSMFFKQQKPALFLYIKSSTNCKPIKIIAHSQIFKEKIIIKSLKGEIKKHVFFKEVHE